MNEIQYQLNINIEILNWVYCVCCFSVLIHDVVVFFVPIWFGWYSNIGAHCCQNKISNTLESQFQRDNSAC